MVSDRLIRMYLSFDMEQHSVIVWINSVMKARVVTVHTYDGAGVHERFSFALLVHSVERTLCPQRRVTSLRIP